MSIKFREFGRIKILDSIRGMAALLVFYHHIFKLNKDVVMNNVNEITYKILNYVSDLNQEAVLIFFIISGFSIGLSTHKRPLKDKRTLNMYLFRRFKRILPIYWIAIGLAFVIGFILNLLHLRDFSLFNFIGNMLFMQTSSSISESWAIPYGLNGPLWSLSFEMFFYLFFPIVYFFNKKYFTQFSITAKYFVLVSTILILIFINKKIVFIPYILFLAGFITWIQGYIATRYFLFYKKDTMFFSINLILGIFISLLSTNLPSETIRAIGKGMLLSGIFYFLMVLLDNLQTKSIENLINKLFFKIGEGSYAIYALHYPFLVYFEYKNIHLGYQLLFAPIFILSCYFLEKKSLKWSLKFLEFDYFKPLRYFYK